MKFSIVSAEIIKCALLCAHAARNNGIVEKTSCHFVLLRHFLGRNSHSLLVEQIFAFRVSRTRFRLSLINALTSVWNVGPVKGAVECSQVNFYGDLNRSMQTPTSLSLFLLFYLSFFMHGLN